MEKNTNKKIRQTHTNGHAQKIRIVQVLSNNMWICQIGRLVSLFYSFKYLLFYFTLLPIPTIKKFKQHFKPLGSLSFNILMPCNSFLV